MAMENYNPPQDPWLVILYQDEQVVVNSYVALSIDRCKLVLCRCYLVVLCLG